jgi:hypothetical protein
MRSILAIVVGVGLIAAGLRRLPDLENMPIFMSVIFVLFGAVLIYAGAYHGWIRFQRRRAYAGGREKRGTVRLQKFSGEDDMIAYLIFATSYAEWLMSVDSSSIRKVREGLAEGLPARAYLGDDDRIYGLDIGEIKALPISVGEPYEGKLRERIEWVERKKSE